VLRRRRTRASSCFTELLVQCRKDLRSSNRNNLRFKGSSPRSPVSFACTPQRLTLRGVHFRTYLRHKLDGCSVCVAIQVMPSPRPELVQGGARPLTVSGQPSLSRSLEHYCSHWHVIACIMIDDEVSVVSCSYIQYLSTAILIVDYIAVVSLQIFCNIGWDHENRARFEGNLRNCCVCSYL